MKNIAESIKQYLKIKDKNEKVNSPEGICPNCWGRQEYGGQFFEQLKNHTMDINSDEPEIGWINEYAEKHLKGIKMQNYHGELVCSKCKYSFNPVSE